MTPPNNTLPAPPSIERLQALVDNGLSQVAQQQIEAHKLPLKIDGGKIMDLLVGTDLWMNRFITVDADTIALKQDIGKVSKTEDEVLIVGETGTGKEMLAKALIGNRKGQTLTVNCAGLPDTLVESELFGYMKGSFTGAEGNREGLMAKAKEGLLFLDEIGELPLGVQGKLLRAIQEKKIRRVGGINEEEITCKFAFATNKNIEQMVKDGQFRQDLYARISTFELDVKPLRDRMCDVEPILLKMEKGKEFYEKWGQQLHDKSYPLTHNVRSLQQYLKRWNVLGRLK